MRYVSFLLFLLICVALTAASGFSQTKSHPLTIHDLLAMERISDPQVSPNGKRIVFVLAKTDLEENSSKTDLWMVRTGGKDLRQLTSHKERDSNPRWDPDGRTIWFLSSRSDSSQVWRIRIDGGEALQVTDEPLDVSNLVVAPDGKHIAFTMEVFPDCNGPAETKKKLDEKEENKATGRMYDKIFIRHWNRWKDGRRSHIFVVELATGEVSQLTDGSFYEHSLDWSPDGEEILFISNREPNPDKF